MTTINVYNSPASRDASWDAFKVLAFALMAFDHAMHFAGVNEWLRLPGRVVFPMFAVMLAYKVYHYSTGRTIKRLAIWACVAQIPLTLLSWPSLNVLGTLCIGLYAATRATTGRYVAAAVLLAVAAYETATGRPVLEYGALGALAVACCYWAQARRWVWIFAGLFLAMYDQHNPAFNAAAVAGLTASIVYVHRATWLGWVKRVPTQVWYALYPLHLLFIWGVSQLL